MLNHRGGSNNPAGQIGSCVMIKGQYDWCETQDHLPSDHGYQYSMGIGDAYTLQRFAKLRVGDEGYTRENEWIGGTLYNYGIGEAHYPVPAILTHTVIEAGYVFQSWQVAIAEDGITPLFTGKYHGKEGNYSGEPNYPVPSTEVDNGLAMPVECVSFLIKRMLLNYVATL